MPRFRSLVLRDRFFFVVPRGLAQSASFAMRPQATPPLQIRMCRGSDLREGARMMGLQHELAAVSPHTPTL